MQGIAELVLDTVAAPPGAERGGVDLVDADRFARALARCGPALLTRIFSKYELAGPRSPAELFGIKESVVKMVGGLPEGARFRHIVIAPDLGALTEVRLTGPLAPWAADRRICASAGPVSGARGEDGSDGSDGSDGISKGLFLAWSTAVRP